MMEYPKAVKAGYRARSSNVNTLIEVASSGGDNNFRLLKACSETKRNGIKISIKMGGVKWAPDGMHSSSE